MSEAVGALSHLRVLELGQLIAGPFCGQLLGDMGADVIKIEAPGVGDPMRSWGQGKPVWWSVIGRNKRSVTLDLRKPEGREVLRRLAAEADILIENFRPGTLEKWELAPEALQALNPRLIVVRVSGFGQTGPYAKRAGYGSIGEAMGGMRYLAGEPDTPEPGGLVHRRRPCGHLCLFGGAYGAREPAPLGARPSGGFGDLRSRLGHDGKYGPGIYGGWGDPRAHGRHPAEDCPIECLPNGRRGDGAHRGQSGFRVCPPGGGHG